MAQIRGRNRDWYTAPISLTFRRRPALDAILSPFLDLGEEEPSRSFAFGAPLAYAYEKFLEKKRDAQKAKGAFYTPPHLVDFIIEQTIGASVDQLSVEEILKIKILDPSCGGGIFLIAALKRLIYSLEVRGVPCLDEACSQIISNSLYGVDIDSMAIDVAVEGLLLFLPEGHSQKTDVAKNFSCKDFLKTSNADFESIASNFDFIIGNPPWGQKRYDFHEDDRKWLKNRFKSGAGVFDPYKFFIERSIEVLENNKDSSGIWAFVLPDIILLKNQQPIRDLILERSLIQWIVHVGRAFPGVNIDSVVMIGRGKAGNYEYSDNIRIWRELPISWREETPKDFYINQSFFYELPEHKFNIYITKEEHRIWQKMTSLGTLGDMFEIHEGVHTGNVRSKLFNDDKSNINCTKVVVGRNEIRPFQIKWGGKWIDLSPNLIRRDKGEYCNCGRPEWYDLQKIVVRRTGDRVLAAFDSEGLYFSNNLFILLPRKPLSATEMRAIVSLLNSNLMTWFFRTVQPRKGRLFAELKIRQLKTFPVPALVSWPEGIQEKLAKYCQYRESGGELNGARLDEIVFCLFQLTERAQKIVISDVK